MDFSGCLADPNSKSFVEDFKKLHKDFRGRILTEMPLRNLFEYIVYTYDKESPYVKDYPDWAQRRRETAMQSGFPLSGKKYASYAEEILLGKNKSVNNIVLRYLYLQNDIEFVNFVVYSHLYYKQMQEALSSTYDNPASYDKLQKNLTSLSSLLKDIKKKIFSGDETEGYLKSLYDFTSQNIDTLMPESRAEKIENGEPPVAVSPYGEGYIPDKMKFIGDE